MTGGGRAGPDRTGIASVRDGDRLMINLMGSLDAMSVSALRTQLFDLTQVHELLGLGAPVRHIHIDLAAVDFCDAAGVRMLTAAWHIAAARDVSCHLHRPQPHIRWLLQATEVAALFELEE